MSKHLSLSERSIIESMLNKDFTFAQIAKKLGRTGSTISREVHKRRIFTGKFDNYTHNDCIYFFSCLKNTVCPKHPTHGCFTRCKLCSEADCTKLCDRYVSCNCELLNKPPYVCTGCPKQKSCKKEHAYYTATKAHADYLSELKKARSGIRTSKEELLRINDIIAPLIMRGQSINHILANHKDEIGLSEKTIYNYIDSCAFHVRNIDLPKKVAYRQRRQKHVFTSMDYKYRKGRSYDDFKKYTTEHPDEEVVEMDTVKGARGSGKVLLTLIFRKSKGEPEFSSVILRRPGRSRTLKRTMSLSAGSFRRALPLTTFPQRIFFLFAVILTLFPEKSSATNLPLISSPENKKKNCSIS